MNNHFEQALRDDEARELVKAWRAKSPAVVGVWDRPKLQPIFFSDGPGGRYTQRLQVVGANVVVTVTGGGPSRTPVVTITLNEIEYPTLEEALAHDDQ